MNSYKNTLNGTDLKQWFYETFMFSFPAIIAILASFANTLDWRIALGAGAVALTNALQNLYGKLKAGATAPEVPVTPVVPVATPDTTSSSV